MATQTTATGTLSPTIQTYYDRKLLKRMLPNLVHRQFGQKRGIPAGNGKTANFRKFSSLAPATNALTEGVTPAGNAITITEVTATVSQYGDFVEVSDMLDLTAIDPVVDEMSDVLGEQGAETVDIITREALVLGTNVQYAAGRVSRVTVAAGDNLTVSEIRKAVRTLKRNKAKPVDGKNYIAIVEPGTTYDLQSDTKWEEAAKYAGATQIFSGEIGRLYGVRFVETTNAKKFAGAGASAIDVMATLVIGGNAYGVIDVAGKGNVKMIVKPKGSAGTADPLDQRSTVGWKVEAYVAKILEQAAMVRIEHAVSG